MYTFLYYLYFIRFKNQKIDQIYKRVAIRILNILLPFLFKIDPFQKKMRINTINKKPEFIVSLTSFPPRIIKVWLVIETLLRQKKKPDKIILWLYEGEFNGRTSLPANLLRLEKRGLEIRFCKENLRPHKKYFYTMLENPDAIIITIDDDMFYPLDLTEKLFNFYRKYQDSIICTLTREIKIDGNRILPYVEWEYLKKNTKPSKKNLIMGCGGALFPPNSLHPDVFNTEILKKFALTADDLWLKVMSLRVGTRVVSIGGEYPRFFIPVIQKNRQPLMDFNIGQGQNDKIFKALLEFYKISINIFNE